MKVFNRTILVVEDEALIRFAVADALEDAGYTVLEAANVLEAVAILGSHDEIDAVITDIDMPGSLNGIDLAKFVATHTRHMGIAVTSGRPDIDLACLPAGARFLPKPCAASAIVELATDILAPKILPRRHG